MRYLPLIVLLAGCPKTGPGAADVTAYAADQQACVQTSTSRAEATECVAAVRDRWCAEWPTAANCVGDAGGIQ